MSGYASRKAAAARAGQLQLVPDEKPAPRVIAVTPEDEELFRRLTDGDDIWNYLGYDKEAQHGARR